MWAEGGLGRWPEEPVLHPGGTCGRCSLSAHVRGSLVLAGTSSGIPRRFQRTARSGPSSVCSF